MAQNPQHVHQLTYKRSETPNISDHKPVFSTLRCTIKDVVKEKREAIYQELMHVLDRFENQTLPMVSMDKIHLDFGEIRYGQSVMLPIQVTNTGNVVAHFRFVPKLDEVSYFSETSQKLEWDLTPSSWYAFVCSYLMNRILCANLGRLSHQHMACSSLENNPRQLT